MIETAKGKAQRRAWVKPELRPMTAGSAELGTQRIRSDGDFTQS